jgi:hypothetical protein
MSEAEKSLIFKTIEETGIPLCILLITSDKFNQLECYNQPPLAINYLIENVIGLTGIHGHIIDHFDTFSPTTVKLTDHLKLNGVRSVDRIKLTKEQFEVIWNRYPRVLSQVLDV